LGNLCTMNGTFPTRLVPQKTNFISLLSDKNKKRMVTSFSLLGLALHVMKVFGDIPSLQETVCLFLGNIAFDSTSSCQLFIIT